MPFSQAAITSVAPPTFEQGLMTLSWVSTAPAGTWYQIYINLKLVWDGQITTDVTVAVPSGPVNSCDIGTVAAGEQLTDFSSTIAGSNLFATLTWLGGSFESPDLVGFYVYQGLVAGGAVSFVKPVATIQAYPQGIVADGYGYGGYGQGGYGQSAGAYKWTSAALASGMWNFAVSPFDSAGNIGTPRTCSVPISAPPLEPAANAAGARLTYIYNPTLREVTLDWLASPSA